MRKTRGRGSGRGGGGTRDTKLSVDNNISNNEPSPPKGRRSKRQQEIGGRANVDLKASRKSASTARRASTKRNGSIASVQRFVKIIKFPYHF
jgi:hypothetical protein